MSDYGTMQTRIADELSRADLSAQIATSITSAIDHYGKQEFFWNHERSTASTVAGQANYALPTDFVRETLFQVLNGAHQEELFKENYDIIKRRNSYSTIHNVPENYAIFDNQFWLALTPNIVYTITLAYIKKLTALSATTDTNAWMTDGENLIRSRAKWDLYTHVIRSSEDAITMKYAENEALQELRNESNDRIATGYVRPYYR